MPARFCYIFVADWRAHNFDSYRQSNHIKYILKRGAKIDDLLPVTINHLGSVPYRDFALIKIAAGINDLTAFTDTTSASGKRVLKRSDLTPEQVITKLKKFKESLFSAHFNSIVTFVSIPPASCRKFQAYKYKNLDTPILSDEDLASNQTSLDQAVNTVNSFIHSANREPQFGITPRSLSWHTSVRKKSKRRKRSGQYSVTLRNDFARLYDGLHAVSVLKFD